MNQELCADLDEVGDGAQPKSTVCDQCIALGDTWVHLRSCLICGQVGCCENSKNTHARKHWQEGGHAVIRSIEPGESWRYCYPHDLLAM